MMFDAYQGFHDVIFRPSTLCWTSGTSGWCTSTPSRPGWTWTGTAAGRGAGTAAVHHHCICHVQDLRRVLPVRARPPHGGAGAGPPLGAAPRRRGARLERGPQERRHHGQQVGHRANSVSEVCQNVPRVCKISARVSVLVPWSAR